MLAILYLLRANHNVFLFNFLFFLFFFIENTAENKKKKKEQQLKLRKTMKHVGKLIFVCSISYFYIENRSAAD